jgi:hypothetical protein
MRKSSKKSKGPEKALPEDVKKINGLPLSEAPADFDFNELRLSAIHLLVEKRLPIISGLLRVSKMVRDDKAIDTAAIGRISGKLVILYNGDFVYTFASTPLDFAAVLLHEVMHELLGHLSFEDYIGNRDLWNIAQDAIINQALFSLNVSVHRSSSGSNRPTASKPNPSTGFHITRLFETIYPLEGLFSILRPPSPLSRIRTHEKVADETMENIRKHIYPILEGRSGPSQVTEHDLYKILSGNLCQEDYKNITIIGVLKSEQSDKDQGSEEKSRSNKEAKDFEESANGASDKSSAFKPGVGEVWNDFILEGVCEEISKQSKSAGRGEKELASRVITKLKTRNKNLEAAFDQALLNGTKSKIAAYMGNSPRLGRSVVIGADMSRTDLLKLASGYWPIFFSKNIIKEKRGKAHVYIDVSGSVNSYLQWMYGCINEVEKNTETILHIFSNKVYDITKEDFMKGLVRTTGGTDFDCVVENALQIHEKTGDNKFIIFTDGYGSITRENENRIIQNKLTFIGALLGDHGSYYRTKLEEFCTKVFVIPQDG